MRLKLKYPSFCLAFILLLGACTEQEHKYEFLVFGTLVEVEIYALNKDKAQSAARLIQQEFNRIHTLWHAWEDGGVLTKINQAIANEKPIRLAPEIINFLKTVKELSIKSEGYFNPAIGNLVALWGFHSDNWQGAPPDAKQIARFIKPPIIMQSIRFNGDELFSLDHRIKLDMGGVVKGYALQFAINTLKQQGIKNALVNTGGDLQVLGSKHNKNWNIGIKSPAGVIGSIQIKNGESIVSSGNYERQYEYAGKIYHHLINPKTGWPATGISAVTVISNDPVLADSASTAILVSGIDNWQRIAGKMQVEYVLVVDYENKIYLSEEMKTRFNK